MVTNLMTPAIKKALFKFLVSFIVLVGVIVLCCSKIDQSIAGPLAVFATLVLLPTTILLSIDASRVINKDLSGLQAGYAETLGRILGMPQIFLGLLLMVIGIGYPILALTKVVGANDGLPFLTPLVVAAVALLMVSLGYFYLREGLRLVRGSKSSTLSAPKSHKR